MQDLGAKIKLGNKTTAATQTVYFTSQYAKRPVALQYRTQQKRTWYYLI
jgi:hypothetical protein